LENEIRDTLAAVPKPSSTLLRPAAIVASMVVSLYLRKGESGKIAATDRKVKWLSEIPIRQKYKYNSMYRLYTTRGWSH